MSPRPIRSEGLTLQDIVPVVFLREHAPSASQERKIGKQLDKGIAFYRAGQFAEAARIFEGILRRDRADVVAAYLLGVTRLATDDNEGAHRVLTRAAASDPKNAEALRALGEACDRLGRVGDAIAAYRRAEVLAPNDAGLALSLGVALLAAGEATAALAASDKAARLQPGLAVAHNNAGLALKMRGDHSAARDRFDQALSLDPDFALAAFNLGKMLFEDREVVEAEPLLRRALALAPRLIEARLSLADLLRETARTDEALAELDAILALVPNHAVATVWCAIFELPVLYRSEEEVGLRRARYTARLAALENAVAEHPSRYLAGFATTRPFFLTYQGENDRDLQQLYGKLLSASVQAAVGFVQIASEQCARIRVGIVGGYFRHHSVWKIPTRGWLEGLDRARFELIAYHTGVLVDDQTELARGLCDGFVQGPLDLGAWAKRLAGDACDVLLYPEIGMDPMAAQLATLRLAPLQINGLGHPTPSGLATLDVALTSALMEPDDAASHYGERLERLPNLGIRYEPGDVEIERVRRRPSGDAFAFWCPQSLFKYLPQFDEVFPRIAVSVPHARFVFIRYPVGDAVTDAFAKRLTDAFARHGLAMSDHCRFLPRLDQNAFVAAAGECDAMLDGLGWSGFNSTLESLVHDLPLVAFEGRFMRGRHSAAILRVLGLPEMITDTSDTFVALAVRLAKDDAFRHGICERMAAARHRLYRDNEPIKGLERLLEREASARLSSA